MRENDVHCCEPEFWLFMIICFALVAAAGLASGLALGLLSFSQIDLEVLIKAGQPHERKNAAKIVHIVKNQHLLLCTLLIGKSLAMEALPIFLDSIVPTWAAILISVTLVMTFAEVLPQAVCARYGLSFGAKLSTLVRLLLLVLFPIAYPISRLLDWLLGKEHSALLRRAELKTLVDLHGDGAGKGGELTHHETTIIAGALDLTQKTAKDAMTAIRETFALDINSKLDKHTMSLVMSKGHSRIPVYSGSPKNIIGLILVKNLMMCRAEDETPIKNITLRRIPRVQEDWPLYDILKQFQKGHSHMAVVVKCKNSAEKPAGKPESLAINVNSNFKQTQVERKGDSFQKVHPNKFRTASCIFPSYAGCRYPTPEDVVEPTINLQSHPKKSEGKDGKLVTEDLNSLPSDTDDIIGIITMEDVMEELLQENILDETDEYVDVHNKIRINLLPPRRPWSISSGASSVSRLQWRNPESSPPSYIHTPILHSPVAPYIQPRLTRPVLCDSPGLSVLSSPAGSTGTDHYSPSSHYVSLSRKCYEKLQKSTDS